MTEKDFNILFDKTQPVQNREELWWLTQKVKKIKPKVIVEIGVEFAGTLGIWGHLLSGDGILIGVDINGNHEKRIEKNIEDVPCEKHMLFADSHEEKTKQNILSLLNGRKIDFLFLDGDHTFDGVKNDYLMYAPLVKKDGIIGFHDINDKGVSKLWRELRGEKHEKTVRIGIGYQIKQ